MKTARKQDIVMAYVLATKGRLPNNLDSLLQAMREIIGDVSESKVRKAIAWALQQPLAPRSPKAPRQRRKMLRAP
jgi:3-methyladenine DNA glycosylase AlkD